MDASFRPLSSQERALLGRKERKVSEAHYQEFLAIVEEGG